MKILFTSAAAVAVAALAVVSTHAEEAANEIENEIAMPESDVELAERPTWDKFMHNHLYDLMSDCEEMEGRDDENIPWTCDRFYLHEDAYPALQLGIRVATSRHPQNLLRLPLSGDVEEDIKTCEKLAVDAYRGVYGHITEIDILAKELRSEMKKDMEKIQEWQAVHGDADGEMEYEPSPSLHFLMSLDLSAKQLDDLCNLRNFPVVQERVQQASEHFFLTALKGDCEHLVSAVLAPHESHGHKAIRHNEL